MAETVFRGPAYSAGAVMDGRVELTDGPGLEYQANGFPDIRYFPTRKDGLYPGRVPAFLNSPFTVLVDAIPSAVSTTAIAAAANVTNGTAMTLVTVAAGGSSGVPSFAPSVPLVPFLQGSSALVNAGAIDFGFTTGTTTAGNASVPVPDSSLFALGQWICIGGAGNSAKTASLITQVIGSADATHITVNPAPSGSLSNAPIGNCNVPGPLPGSAPNAVSPYITGGLGTFFNPAETIARCISITGSASATGGTFTVRGWDVYGVPMSENITIGAGAVTKFGQKAFKYIKSVTPGFTDAHNYSVGYGDTFGLHIRSDKWEFLNIFYNGTFATTSSGWLARDNTNPATATTGDVRGTVQTSANGNGSTPSAPLNTATNGSIRLTIAMTVPLYNNLFGTPLNSVPMFGQTQFTN